MAKILTESDILNATSYLSIARKQAMAQAYANGCVRSATENDNEKEVSQKIYKEDSQMRMMYGMLVLLKEYLHQKKDDEITTEEYDEWGKVAIFNQLDRFKASKNVEVRNKAYDIVDDYREFYRMLGQEINTVLMCKNDTIARFIDITSNLLTSQEFINKFLSKEEINKNIATEKNK